MWFWILSWDKEGRYTLLGPYNSMWGAQKIADKLENEYEIEKLPTRNMTKATKLLKFILTEREPEKFSKYVKYWRHKEEEEKSEKDI